jgi:hypothetical protein
MIDAGEARQRKVGSKRSLARVGFSFGDFIPREIAAAGVDCESTGTPPAWLNGGAPRPLLYNGSRVRGAAMATRAAGRVFRAKKNPAAG